MKVINDALKHVCSSTRNSARGLSATFRHEMAFRQEVLLTIPHFLILYMGGFDLNVWLALSVLLALVFSFELLNTAIECVVDLVSPEYHELAGRAKDAASAAVGVCLLAYGLSWGLIIWSKWQ